MAEQLGDADLPGLAPVGAVAGEGDVGAAEGEVLRRHELRAAGEDVVVGLQNEAGMSGGGDDDGRHSAESEEYNRAESLGESGEGVVGHVGYQVEVADDRKSSRRRRLSVTHVLPFAGAEDVEDEDEEEDDGQESEEGRFGGKIVHLSCLISCFCFLVGECFMDAPIACNVYPYTIDVFLTI